jgi:DNA-3-methyladenine glycosylase
VEVEAYGGQGDAASHARFGPTDRNRVMFGPPGVAYVYMVYGMYDCLNVVTDRDGVAGAVLVRAATPLEGIGAMRASRFAQAARRRPSVDPRSEERRIAALPAHRLASGPGLLAAAFGIERSDTGVDLCDARLALHLEPPADDDPPPVGPVRSGPRIGIGYAAEPWRGRPWRFWLAGDRSVSRPDGLRPASR